MAPGRLPAVRVQLLALPAVSKGPQQELRRFKMHSIRGRLLLVYLFLIAGILVGCSPKSTPPGANSIYGGVEEARFSYHYWEEGLAILIWHDFLFGSEGCGGSSSTEDPFYRLECDVESGDGQAFGWIAHTRDGVTADIWIDDQGYDLSQGNMFLISSQAGGIQVDQIQRDFSELEPTVEAIAAMAESDMDVAAFITRLSTGND